MNEKVLKKGSFDLFIFIYLFDLFISGPGLESSHEAYPPNLGFSMFDGIKFFQQKYLSIYLFVQKLDK